MTTQLFITDSFGNEAELTDQVLFLPGRSCVNIHKDITKEFEATHKTLEGKYLFHVGAEWYLTEDKKLVALSDNAVCAAKGEKK